MILENRYKNLKNGKTYKVINFTTTMDCIMDIITLKELDTDNTLEVDEYFFRNNYVKIK